MRRDETRLPDARRWRCRRRRRGLSMVWTIVVTVALAGFCSLAVDVGRVQVVKTELRQAADAAARHAAQALSSTGPAAARANAVAAAADNKAGGTSVVLDAAADVEFGRWDAAARAFTLLTGANESTADAVRVTARRNSTRGNAVALSFGPAIGVRTANVSAVSVARVNPRKPGIVGLDSITMSGSSGAGNSTTSYRSKSGAFTGTSTTYGRGTIASNGSISIAGNSQISGDARPGPGKSVTVTGGASVSGITTPLTKALDYPAPSAGTYATGNDNWRVSSSYLDASRNFTVGSADPSLPAGNYYFNDVTVGSSGSVTLLGPAAFYVTGNVQIAGDVLTSGSNPSNLQIIMLSASTTMNVGSSGNIYADVYAPLSTFKMGGSSTLCGSVIAKAIDMGGSSKVVFDESMTITAPGVSLVR